MNFVVASILEEHARNNLLKHRLRAPEHRARWKSELRAKSPELVAKCYLDPGQTYQELTLLLASAGGRCCLELFIQSWGK